MLRVLLALAALAALSLPALAELPSLTLSADARVEDEGLPEMSGLAPCRTLPGFFWVINDSGNPPVLYALSPSGRVAGPGIPVEGALNLDWEALAAGEGRLYVGDVGNNGSNRRSLTVYEVREPTPGTGGGVAVVRKIRYRYPDQGGPGPKRLEFDCEAMVRWKGALWFLTKHRDAEGRPAPTTRVYRLDERDERGTVPLTLVEGGAGLGGYVTDAAISPDGKTLAVLTLAAEAERRGFIWLYSLPEDGSSLLRGPRRGLRLEAPRQAEGIGWIDGSTLLVANEQRDLFRIPLSAFGPAEEAGPR